MTLAYAALPALLITFGVAIAAAALGGVMIMTTLGDDDRASLKKLFRHPIQTLMSEDEPDPDDWDS